MNIFIYSSFANKLQFTLLQSKIMANNNPVSLTIFQINQNTIPKNYKPARTVSKENEQTP